jgi:hypothetical protein
MNEGGSMKKNLILALAFISSMIGVVGTNEAVIAFDTLSTSDIVTNQFPGLPFSNTIVLTAGFALNEFAPQFSETHTRWAHTIDYLAAPFNGTRLITGGLASKVKADGAIAGTANNANVVTAALNFGAPVSNAAVGAQNVARLTVSAVISAQDTAKWQGVIWLYLVPGNVVAWAIGNNVSPVAAASLTVPLP